MDRPTKMNASELVIKVKYGDTLRRFTVLFNGHGFPNLDMAGLKDKIFSLFKFAPDADLTLTYVDEDHDVVTLVDNDDLRDAIKQRINPLRIYISLNPDGAGGKYDRNGENSTVVGSPHIPSVGPSQTAPMEATHSFSPLFSAVPDLRDAIAQLSLDLTSKVASAAPENYRDLVTKLSHDLVSKSAASYAPFFSELQDSLSKLGTSDQNSRTHQVETLSNSLSDDHPEKLGDGKHSDILKASEDGLATSVVLSNAKTEDHANNAGNLARRRSTRNSETIAPVKVCNDSWSSEVPLENGFKHLVLPSGANSGKMPQKECDGYREGNQAAASGSFYPSPSTAFPVEYNMCPFQGSAISPPAHEGSGVAGSDNYRKHRSHIPVLSPGGFYPMAPSRRSYGSCDNMGRTFHQGVCCDGCGVHPITGPRFKSKVKEDYDLCSICYAELGNEAEYIRMDHPVSYRSSRLPKHSRFGRPLLLPHGLRSCGLRSSYRSKHDSRFIADVNIADGTLMGPKTPFIKIWRIRNNGAVAWPRGTQLVWIGGHQLTDIKSFEVELPLEGCCMDTDLDVAVEFTAPERPGQYVSYWRLALPSGQKFGQCIWVLIQVDAQLDSESESCRSFNLNLPPDGSDSKDHILDVNAEPVDDSYQNFQSSLAEELVKPMVDGNASKDVEADFARGSDLVDYNGSPLFISPEVPAAESYPAVGLSVVPAEVSPVADARTFSGEGRDGKALEQSLLKELDDMGFKQIDLNKEVLRVNEYDLDRSLDDLCDVAEWDPMLEELQEMGFHDNEANRRLLVKNGGSIKRVVMDLIAAEKA
ncbi:hypothetical protein IFM89_030766 [Coptis chinensis]|uniref:Protein NBR1 homolog n=1 Tax=Coptis chinensis TaxID=261450 RepID=A0A835HY97_9MAGN|nr:hypothetical protein IFM89_030766 [Coptis chinensis]